MKRELITTPLKRIRPVFVNVGENIKRYDQMRSLFTPDAARLFAEPLVSGAARDHITWYSDFGGPFRTFSSLSNEEQERALPLLNEQVNHLFRDLIRFVRKGAGQYDRTQYVALRRGVESALQVPAYDDILLFATPAGLRFVLINWGFTLDLDNAERDLIRRLVPFGVTPVGLIATYQPSGAIATDEPLSVRWESQKTIVTTDAEGRALLPQVPYLSELTVSQTDASGHEANRQTVLIDERDPASPYPVILQRLSFPMLFRVVNQQGVSVPNHPVRLEYRGLSILATSDSDGKLVRTDTQYGDTILSYNQKDPKAPLVQTHTFRRDQAEYLIPVVIPDPLAPVKKGFKYTGLLLLLLFLIGGGLLYWFYLRNPLRPEVMRGNRGAFNVNMHWLTDDDLDLHVTDAGSNEIWFKRRQAQHKGALGFLDIDENASPSSATFDAQENVYWNKVIPGKYRIEVVLYDKRGVEFISRDIPFVITVTQGDDQTEYSGTIRDQGQRVLVKEVEVKTD